jgi:hypothetical protein
MRYVRLYRLGAWPRGAPVVQQHEQHSVRFVKRKRAMHVLRAALLA